MGRPHREEGRVGLNKHILNSHALVKTRRGIWDDNQVCFPLQPTGKAPAGQVVQLLSRKGQEETDSRCDFSRFGSRPQDVLLHRVQGRPQKLSTSAMPVFSSAVQSSLATTSCSRLRSSITLLSCLTSTLAASVSLTSSTTTRRPTSFWTSSSWLARSKRPQRSVSSMPSSCRTL